jgi:copper(I)-binding protein
MKTRWPTSTAGLLALCCALGALAATPAVDVSDAWVRATVPGQLAAGAFMKITSRANARLVGASSPVAKIAEVHEMKLEAGVMKMRAADRLELPAGKAVTLAPGGYHVMLMGLAQPLREGDAVPITLTIEDAGGARRDVRVTAAVRAIAAPMPGR